jgi:hypothetical protein
MGEERGQGLEANQRPECFLLRGLAPPIGYKSGKMEK